MKTLAYLLFALLAGCAASRVELVSTDSMSHDAARMWCDELGSRLAPIEEIDVAIELCDTTGLGACWIGFSSSSSSRYIVALDGSLYPVGRDYEAPAVCIGVR